MWSTELYCIVGSCLSKLQSSENIDLLLLLLFYLRDRRVASREARISRQYIDRLDERRDERRQCGQGHYKRYLATRERDEEIRTGLAKLLNKEQNPPLRRSIVDPINSKQGIQKAFGIRGMVWEMDLYS